MPYISMYLVLFLALSLSHSTEWNGFSTLPSNEQKELFAPGIVTNGWHENSLTFSPEQNEILYVVADKSYEFQTIVGQRKRFGSWGRPYIVSFSGIFKDSGPLFDPRGDVIYFNSIRPGNINEISFDIWVTHRIGNNWCDPINLGSNINSEFHDANPSVDSSGNIYFQSNRDGNWDIYCSLLENGELQLAKPLNGEINSSFAECDPYVASDGSFIIFHSDRKDSYGGMDLYISQLEGKKWGAARNLGNIINCSDNDYGATISPDGKFLFYSSFQGFETDNLKNLNYKKLSRKLRDPRNGYATIFWIDTSVLNIKL